ncbi:unnamed protein product [Camellia sinensis]
MYPIEREERNEDGEEFPRWFKERINQLRAEGSSEATDELWSLANGPRDHHDTKTTQMPPGQATKRRSTTSMSEANLVELPTASPVDAFASVSPVDASPSSQTVDIVVPRAPDVTLKWWTPVGLRGPSVKRVRGPTRGKNSSRLISQHCGKKLFVGVSIERRTFVGLNASKAANELGAQIRLQAPLQGTKNWEDVPPVIRAAIVQSLRDKFEIEGYDDSPLPQEIIDTKATHLFKGWRYHMHEHYKELVKEGTGKPFVGVREEDWRYMIDEVFLGDTHKKRSTRNIANRKKLPYNHTMGSRSFSAAISIEGIETGKEPHIVDFFKTSHWSKKKKDWIEPVCAELYEKMDQLREESSQPGATPLTQEEITVQVLGKRSGYLRGFGVGPKPSSAFNSTTRSQARDAEVKGLKEEVASLKGIIQSYEGRFEQFEHFMRQMQGNGSGYDSFDE